MADRRLSSRLMTPNTPRFWPEITTRRGLGASWPRYPLFDVGALDVEAGETLGALDSVVQRVAVVWIAGQGLGMQHELAGRRAVVGGDDRDLDPDLWTTPALQVGSG